MTIIMWKIIVLFVATQVLATIMAVSLMLQQYPVGLMAANAFLLMYLFLLVGTHHRGYTTQSVKDAIAGHTPVH